MFVLYILKRKNYNILSFIFKSEIRKHKTFNPLLPGMRLLHIICHIQTLITFLCKISSPFHCWGSSSPKRLNIMEKVFQKMEWEPDPNCEVQVIWINHVTSDCQWIHSLLAFIFLKIWSSFLISHCLWIYAFFFFRILSSYKEDGVKPVNLPSFIPFREVAGEDMPTPRGTETKVSWPSLVIFDRRKRLTWEIPLTDFSGYLLSLVTMTQELRCCVTPTTLFKCFLLPGELHRSC